METKEENILVILGNGFDLQCGLKSKFSDFLNSWDKGRELEKFLDEFFACFDLITTKNPIPDFKVNGNNIKKIVYDDSHKSIKEFSDFNVWKILFAILKILNKNIKNWEWFNVELWLEKIIVDKLIDFERIIKERISSSPQSEGSLLMIIKDHYDSKTELDINDLISILFTTINKYIENNNQNANEWLLSELKDFEKGLLEYLRNLWDDYNSEYIKYKGAAVRLFNKIIDGINNEMNINVLNFNYTLLNKINTSSFRVGGSINFNEFKNLNITNIHGNLIDKNIIIGIDHIEIDENSDKYDFTKTSRVLENNMNNLQDQLVLMPNINTIYFYGHSLEKHDYSYFQSIFDYYDLYNSKMKLIFKYSIYCEEKEKEIKRTQIDSVIKLIQKYGKTLDNKDKGKNLLNKLNLEKRIEIKELENIRYNKNKD